MAAKTPHVSDHAVLRYFERVKGVDVEAVRQHIAGLCAAAGAAGAISVHAEGVSFELSDCGTRVITVTPHNQVPSKTKRRKIAGRA